MRRHLPLPATARRYIRAHRSTHSSTHLRPAVHPFQQNRDDSGVASPCRQSGHHVCCCRPICLHRFPPRPKSQCTALLVPGWRPYLSDGRYRHPPDYCYGGRRGSFSNLGPLHASRWRHYVSTNWHNPWTHGAKTWAVGHRHVATYLSNAHRQIRRGARASLRLTPPPVASYRPHGTPTHLPTHVAKVKGRH
jgi:hypothetical protein